jgi:phospholipid/cholesterol/gamma-HCH transport system substrate-binding protein
MKLSRYIKIALFFIVLGGAGSVYIVLASDGLSAFNTKSYQVVFHDATGLSTRSRVYLAGVPVGKIRAIDLEGNEARITMAILKDVQVHQNARISRKSSSILGTSVLSLDPGTELSPILLPGTPIQTEQAMDMNAVMGTVSEIGAQVTGILKEFQTNQMALLAVSLETFNSIAGKIDANASEDMERISRILESTALISERTERLLALKEEDLAATVSDIRAAMGNIRSISGEIAQGRGNLGQAVYDGALYDSLLSTVQETEKAVVKLQSVLDNADDILGRANGLGILVDSRVQYGFLRNKANAGASLRLEPASGDRWYRIGVNGAGDGINSRTVTSTTSGGATTVVDETKTSYTFSLDAEMARRFGMLTLRGGLLENTAGIGLDVQPVSWLSVSGELFRFNSNGYPNLRGTLTLYPFFNPDANNPFNWIYLQGGVYDALNASRRDFFAGGGLRFSDREIKGMAGLAASAAAAR